MTNDAWTQMLPELLPEFVEKDGERIYSKRTKALISIIDDGLPSAGKPRKVAVIGAGMSGMVAA